MCPRSAQQAREALRTRPTALTLCAHASLDTMAHLHLLPPACQVKTASPGRAPVTVLSRVFLGCGGLCVLQAAQGLGAQVGPRGGQGCLACLPVPPQPPLFLDQRGWVGLGPALLACPGSLRGCGLAWGSAE